MIVYVIHPQRLFSLTLPLKISGSYTLNDLDANNKERMLINISEENGKWIAYSNKQVKIWQDKKALEFVELENYQYLLLQIKGQEGFLVMYTCPVNDESFIGVTLQKDMEFIFGSGGDNAVSCNNPLITHKHAKFTYQGGKWLVQDLSTQYGTFVNNKLINGQVELFHGDVVFILGFKLIVLGNCIYFNNPMGSVRYDKKMFGEIPVREMNPEIEISDEITREEEVLYCTHYGYKCKTIGCNDIIDYGELCKKRIEEFTDVLKGLSNVIPQCENSVVDAYIAQCETEGVIANGMIMEEVGMTTNMAINEYDADNGKWVGITEENLKYWPDKPITFVKDPNELGTNSYLIYQEDENGNLVGMGFTDAATVAAYPKALEKKVTLEDATKYAQQELYPSKYSKVAIDAKNNSTSTTDTSIIAEKEPTIEEATEYAQQELYLGKSPKVATNAKNNSTSNTSVAVEKENIVGSNVNETNNSSDITIFEQTVNDNDPDIEILTPHADQDVIIYEQTVNDNDPNIEILTPHLEDSTLTIAQNDTTNYYIKEELPVNVQKEIEENTLSYIQGTLDENKLSELNPQTQAFFDKEITLLNPTNSEDLQTIIGLKKDIVIPVGSSVTFGDVTAVAKDNPLVFEYDDNLNAYTTSAIIPTKDAGGRVSMVSVSDFKNAIIK